MDSSAHSPSVPPEKNAYIESTVQRCVAARLKFWGLVAGLPFVLLLGGATVLLLFQTWHTRKLTRELNALKTQAVRLDQPVEIFNPAWGTVVDAVDPARIPSRDARDPRHGAVIQQYTPRGNAAQSWRLRTPSTSAGPDTPLTEEAYIKHASSFLRAKDFNRAIDAFQYCLKHYPDSPTAHNALGIAFRDKGAFMEAVESHGRAVALAPDRADFLWERAITRQRSGDLDGAISDCQTALEKKPDFPDAHNTLAIAYRDQRAYAKALTHHDRAVELNPQREDFFRERALTHQANGDPQKAAADTDRSRELLTRPR
jgi:Flp pilus assembly protein TadD